MLPYLRFSQYAEHSREFETYIAINNVFLHQVSTFHFF